MHTTDESAIFRPYTHTCNLFNYNMFTYRSDAFSPILLYVTRERELSAIVTFAYIRIIGGHVRNLTQSLLLQTQVAAFFIKPLPFRSCILYDWLCVPVFSNMYKERERERERKKGRSFENWQRKVLYVVCIFAFIYIVCVFFTGIFYNAVLNYLMKKFIVYFFSSSISIRLFA